MTQKAAPSVRNAANGHFEFKDLPPGEYRLAAESLAWRRKGHDLITLLERYDSRSQAKAAIFNYVEMFYNRERQHSCLGGISPAELERKNVY